jgi:uncharacterized protein with GYD domain
MRRALRFPNNPTVPANSPEEGQMAKFLLQASYTTEGVKGLIKDGGSKRRAAADAAVKSVGGKIEAFYFAFGDSDAIVIVDAPDNVSATAIALTVNASGAIQSRTTVLLTPEEVDQATKKTVSYRPPGH